MSRFPASLPVSLLAAALLCGCAGDGPADARRASGAAEGPRSIVLVVFDTTRADRLGPYGGPAATPTADALAREGAVFESARTPAPVTLPAHATLLTALAPHRHGVRDNGLHRLPEDMPTLAGRLGAAGYATAAVVSAAVLDRQYGLDRGFAIYDDDVSGPAAREAAGGTAGGAAAGLAIAERSATATTDAALAALARLEPPWFLFVHYFDPHADYRPPRRFLADGNTPYDGEIAYADAELGRLLRAVEARPEGPRSVVALTADHGEGLGEHGEATHGVFLYDSTVRVPWILRARGRIPPGIRVAAPAGLADVGPTLIALSDAGPGAALPADVDGRSRAAALDGATGDDATGVDAPLLLETELGFNSYGFAPLRGATDGRHKWIRAPREELYDLAADPGETRNLLPAEAGEDHARALRDAWRAATEVDRRAPPPGDATDAAEAERLERLAGLGYVAASRRPAAAGREEDLPDPKDGIATLEAIGRARARLAAGQPREAAALLQPIVDATPGNLSALMLLGAARLLAGEPAAARAPLGRAARLAPHLVDAHFDLGLAALGAGDPRAAEAAWRRAIEVGPRHLPSVANLADLLRTSGRPEEAQAVLRAARESGLDDPVLDYLEGKLAQERGDRVAARAALGRALRRGGLPEAAARDAQATLRFLGR